MPSSKHVVDREERKTIIYSPKGVRKTSPVTWWSQGYFRYDTLESALLPLLRRNYCAVSYTTSGYLESSHSWTSQSSSLSAGCWDDTLSSVGSPRVITIVWWIRGYFFQPLLESCTSAYWYLQDNTLYWILSFGGRERNCYLVSLGGDPYTNPEWRLIHRLFYLSGTHWGLHWLGLRVNLPGLHYKVNTIPSAEKLYVSYQFAILGYSLVKARTSKCLASINVTDLAGYHTLLFEQEPFNPYFSLKEPFPYEDHLFFDYDAFGDLIWDSPNAVCPWHQYYWDCAKDGTMLEVDDPVFKEWCTKYPGFDDCCGECPGCCAIEYDDDIELVIAKGPNSQVGSGFGSTHNRTVPTRLTTRKTGTVGNGAVLPPKTLAFQVHNFRSN